jgi:primosomal protein N' (replication factor Y)
VIGPAPAPVSRVRGQHTYQLFVRSPSEERFRRLLRDIDAAASGVRLRVDVDPRDVGEFLE